MADEPSGMILQPLSRKCWVPDHRPVTDCLVSAARMIRRGPKSATTLVAEASESASKTRRHPASNRLSSFLIAAFYTAYLAAPHPNSERRGGPAYDTRKVNDKRRPLMRCHNGNGAARGVELLTSASTGGDIFTLRAPNCRLPIFAQKLRGDWFLCHLTK